ncbi:MAG: 16S rRNA (guanine(527)-N(7))-methyltransferase RsmG [Leptolyngbya sp. SIO4C1]|nr:16S rRNA (guanine(527)-N(7))-methyltransferase RsmG [Leptolyngbya sp. SIO4C1]
MTSHSALPHNLPLWQASLGWSPTAEQQQQFQQLYEALLAGNQQLNLTRITTPTAFWEKHLWDSLSGIAPWLAPSDWANSDWANPVQQVIDIGTGGGFPGLPIAIAQPHWQLTLLDSTRKKIQFLQLLAAQLGLEQTAFLAERAERVGQDPQYRGRYDLALVRAVGPASTCAEYALPLLAVGGTAVLFRGQWTATDTPALAAAIAPLGGTLLEVKALTTPLTHGPRHCLYLRKQTPSQPAYPRSVGIPAKHPL